VAKTLKLNNGVHIPALGFGTWQIDPWKTADIVVEALKMSYRLIDTAKIYGNEEGVGEAVRDSGIDRKDIFVTTKLWNSDQGYESGKQAFAGSLKRLGLEYIDLYLIHWPGGGERLNAWKALTEIYESGQAKAIGVSNFTVKHLEELAAHSKLAPAVNQIEFHPFIYEEQKPVLEYCQQHDIVVEAYSPLARGGSQLRHPAIADVAKRHQRTNAQVMLRWAMQHDTVPIPKSNSPERMRENLEAQDFSLSEEDMFQLDNLAGNRTTWDPSGVE
jgi:diketogulonate reductase-like aldo/keto reductase